MKLQQDMTKKKQEMLKTQIECQKVRPSSSYVRSFVPLASVSPRGRVPVCPSGADKPSGEEPRHEARGERQHYEDPKGANGEDYPAAE